MNQPRRYPEWRSDSNGRWRDAFHTFGHLLMTHARDEALKRIPAGTSADTREVARKAVHDALYNVMMMLEGVVGVSPDSNRALEFALICRLRESEKPYAVVEEFELAPHGEEPACMGFHFWTDGEFQE
jgi:hypothetical protein